MHKFINKRYFIKVNIIIILSIYLIFLYLDFASRDLRNIYSINLKYLTIVLCFILSLLINSNGHDRVDTRLVQMSRFFNLIADYFLVISCDFGMGIFFFILVQVTYIIRHTRSTNRKYKNFIFFIIALTIILVITSRIEIPSIEKDIVKLAAIYAVLLITSLYCALGTISRSTYSKNTSFLIALGMFLFFMCDFNVGLYNILKESNISFSVGYLIWLFYLPSQFLLTLSGFDINYLKQVFEIYNYQYNE